MHTAVVEALAPVLGKKTCTVHVAGESYEVAQSVVEALGLTLGATVSSSQMRTLQAAAHKRAAAAAALRYLQGRTRTAREVQRHLAGKEHSEPAVAAVLEDLKASGVVDDERYASWYVEARLGHRPTGKVRLVREMVERGVPRSMADAAVDQVLDPQQELVLARRATEKRLPSLRGLEPNKARRRLGSFLAGRGFPGEVVRQICFDEQDFLPSEPEGPPND